MGTPRTEVKESCKRRAAALKAGRVDWLPVWRDIRDYFCPDVGRALDVEDVQLSNEAAKRHDDKIINSEPVLTVDRMAAGFMAGLTPPWSSWFKVGIDGSGAETHIGKLWAEHVQTVLERLFSASNFYAGALGAYKHLTFGTACGMMRESLRDGISFSVFDPGSYALGCDYNGRVDTVYRTFPFSVAQLRDEFGADNLTQDVKSELERGNLERMFMVHHLVEPNDERLKLDETMLGKERMGWRSIYWLDGGDAEAKAGVLAVRGFRVNPIIAPRWDLAFGTYGVGPGKKALGDAKQLQRMESDKLRGIAKSIRPPMMAPASMKSDGLTINANPDGVTYYPESGDATGKPVIQSLYQVPLDIAGLSAEEKVVENRIAKAFFIDIFLALSMARENSPTPGTAYEASKLIAEKMLMAGPVYLRLHAEMLDRAIETAYAIATALGLIDDPPEELNGSSLKIEYISLLAQSMKASGLTGLEHFIGFVGNVSKASPDVLDNVDWDRAARKSADMIGVSEGILRDPKEVQARREARAKAAEAQQQAQMMAAAAAGAKDLGQASIAPGTALGALAGSEAA